MQLYSINAPQSDFSLTDGERVAVDNCGGADSLINRMLGTTFAPDKPK
ncbi:hypothetical protein [Adonisia turfae]|nr:hypothetical protein [Adonisia turfae]